MGRVIGGVKSSLDVFSESRTEEVKPFIEGKISSIVLEYHTFSQGYVFVNLHRFYLRSFKAGKGLKYLPPTKLKNIVRPKVKFFEPVPQRALPPFGTSPNWHFLKFFCAIEM